MVGCTNLNGFVRTLRLALPRVSAMFRCVTVAYLTAFVVLFGIGGARCPNSCSGHGGCGKFDLCTCWANWQGLDCSERTCEYDIAWATDYRQNPHSYAECSGKGLCDRTTGLCTCFDGYTGSACQRSVCPNDCSGHGKCRLVAELPQATQSQSKVAIPSDSKDTLATVGVATPFTGWDGDKIQACICDGGFFGPDCSMRNCPTGDDPLTTCPEAIPGQPHHQVQTLVVASQYVTGATNFFVAIEDFIGELVLHYTDSEGGVWTTGRIGDAFTANSDFFAGSTATLISNALTALPNFKVPSVTVTANGGATYAAPSGTNAVFVGWDITFLFYNERNSGEQNLLSCDPLPLGCQSAGCSPLYQQPKTWSVAFPSASGQSSVEVTTATGVAGFPIGGSYTFSIGGYTTPQSVTASAATLQAAIQSLGVSNGARYLQTATVTDTAASSLNEKSWTIYFQDTSVPETVFMSGGQTRLSSVTVAEVQPYNPGGGPDPNIITITTASLGGTLASGSFSFNLDGATFTVAFDETDVTLQAALQGGVYAHLTGGATIAVTRTGGVGATDFVWSITFDPADGEVFGVQPISADPFILGAAPTFTLSITGESGGYDAPDFAAHYAVTHNGYDLGTLSAPTGAYFAGGSWTGAWSTNLAITMRNFITPDSILDNSAMFSGSIPVDQASVRVKVYKRGHNTGYANWGDFHQDVYSYYTVEWDYTASRAFGGCGSDGSACPTYQIPTGVYQGGSGVGFNHAWIGNGLFVNFADQNAFMDSPQYDEVTTIVFDVGTVRCAITESVRSDVSFENIECSGRGTCDHSLGVCNCFEGHEGDHCHLQTTLV